MMFCTFCGPLIIHERIQNIWGAFCFRKLRRTSKRVQINKAYAYIIYIHMYMCQQIVYYICHM